MNYETLPDADRVTRAAAGLKERGFEPHVVENGAAALELVKTLIPAGASVMNGTSATLQEIGFVELLKSGQHGWNNLHEAILKEEDPARQAELRRLSVLSDAYIGSVHALTEAGELVIASASGSQLPHIVYTSSLVVLVASTKKITTDLADAMRRLTEHVYPLEDARMKETGAPGSVLSKVLTYERHPGWGRTIHVVLVNQDLGF